MEAHKLLLDSCVWSGVRDEVRAAGHDVDWVGDWPVDPGDEEILTRARGEQRILVTLDKDFGEMAVLGGKAHSGIIRLVAMLPRQQAGICLQVLSLHVAELQQGAIVTATTFRIRIRAFKQDSESE
jgi:predicted nuclease of predicted toxin-antitoxin system